MCKIEIIDGFLRLLLILLYLEHGLAVFKGIQLLKIKTSKLVIEIDQG